MKKLLGIAACALLMGSMASCNQKGASSGEGAAVMDSISMMYGDLFGAQMQGIKNMDSTISIDKVLQGVDYMTSADTSRAFLTGVQAGMNIMQMYMGLEDRCGYPVNKKLFMEHLRAAINSSEPMDQAKMMEMQNKLTPLLERAVAQSPKALKNKKDGEEYVNKLKAEDKDYKTTSTGLTYKFVKKGPEGGKTFGQDDDVKLTYVGKHIDGSEFDSSRGDTVTFNLKTVVPGFREMLMLMKPGDKVTAVLPAEIAYGANGNQGIEPNETLVFDIEAVGVAAPNEKRPLPKPGAPRNAPPRH